MADRVDNTDSRVVDTVAAADWDNWARWRPAFSEVTTSHTEVDRIHMATLRTPRQVDLTKVRLHQPLIHRQVRIRRATHLREVMDHTTVATALLANSTTHSRSIILSSQALQG